MVRQPLAHPRLIPSIEQLLQRTHIRDLETRYGRNMILEVLREEVEIFRRKLATTSQKQEIQNISITDSEQVAEHIEQSLEDRLHHTFNRTLRTVINATGVIVHTNLGRAPLTVKAAHRIVEIATGYSNLEYNLEAGNRGARHVHSEALLCSLTGAQAALVVNNNAAAVLIMLSALAKGREVIVSRGELVEIGGGFRIPDMMLQSGAKIREVGTTNKTRVADYAAAINERSSMILRVHPSNFRIEGFTERPTLEALISIGRQFKLPVCEDLGSGNLLSYGYGKEIKNHAFLIEEPSVRSSINIGADVVCFSGDKLLGGPQAGIMVGRHEMLAQISKHPLMRALRVDKITYAALDATLLEYARGHAPTAIPVLQMINIPASNIENRARDISKQLQTSPRLKIAIINGLSTIGGGSSPGIKIPSRLLSVSTDTLRPNELEARLRHYNPPIIARIEHDQVLLDLRTVLPEQDQTLVEALTSLNG